MNVITCLNKRELFLAYKEVLKGVFILISLKNIALSLSGRQGLDKTCKV